MSYDGGLLYLGGSIKLPHSYIKPESYTIVPNRRQDLDSTRNANGVLVRNVLEHTATTINIQTVPLNNTQLAALMSLLRNNYSSQQEKKIRLRYYCPDLDDYKTGDFYVPDVEYPIAYVPAGKNTIEYNPITLEFIEY